MKQLTNIGGVWELCIWQFGLRRVYNDSDCIMKGLCRAPVGLEFGAWVLLIVKVQTMRYRAASM